jgi:hypothetical protein
MRKIFGLPSNLPEGYALSFPPGFTEASLIGLSCSLVVESFSWSSRLNVVELRRFSLHSEHFSGR